MSDLSPRARELVIAAALGDDALGETVGGTPAVLERRERRGHDTPELFLTAISAAGFRGIGPPARLGLVPGPGLTLVVGRNGSGKSSFAEAAEVALTETSYRWQERAKRWQDGWRCLHHDGERSVELSFRENGADADTVVRRSWPVDADVDEGTCSVQRAGAAKVPFAELGLADALSTWRPFLSYSELGSLLEDNPSKLHDAISSVLGLHEWDEAAARLDSRRTELTKRTKATKAAADELRTKVSSLDDAAADAASSALGKGWGWDADELDRLATATEPPSAGTGALRRLADLVGPDPEEAATIAAALRSAAARAAELADTDGARASELAELLEQALTARNHTDDASCPVCGTAGVLDRRWVARTNAEISRLRAEADDVDAAERRLRAAVGEARRLVDRYRPPSLETVADGGPDVTALVEVWSRWANPTDDPERLAAHVEDLALTLAAEIEAVRTEAAGLLDARRDAWRPVADEIRAWLPAARAAADERALESDLKDAAKWIRDAANVERTQRLRPIVEEVRAHWATMRNGSNVALEDVALTGTRTRRGVDLQVRVDTTEGAALSVMSQGELHTLALALFLPRATLADSPFRFVLIDDPVQAMDHDKVAGLAKVLEHVAATRQVVVFTHDDRLPAACRQLGVAARVLEVSRGERSSVSIRLRDHPALDYLRDARAVLKTDGYPPDARRRVVPGLCRSALEAACIEVGRSALLDRGTPHHEVEEVLGSTTSTMNYVALAFFADPGRTGDVYREANRRWRGDGYDLLKALKAGAHDLIDDHPEELVTRTQRAVRNLLGSS
ncbi:MAG: AAA family ATPase [Actinomycetota bacterium]|nr:AAA family ATPase [Actinomycetota bacterium]